MRKLLQQFAFVVVPKLLSGMASTGISMVLLRYFAPAPFGALTLCLSCIMLADALLGSAFDLTAVRLASEKQGAEPPAGLQIQRACMLLKLLALAVAATAVFFARHWVMQSFFKGQQSGMLLVWTGLTAAAVLLLRSSQLNYQLAGRFQLYGLLDIASNGLKCAGVALLILRHQVAATQVLVVFFLAPSLVLAAWAILGGRQLLSGWVTLPQLRTSVQTASWFFLTFGVGALVARIDLWLVAKYTTAYEVGIYSAAQLLALVLPMLGTYLSVVISPRVLPLFRSGQLLPFTYTLQAGLLAAAIVAYLACVFGLSHLSQVFPLRFQTSLPLFLVLLPGALAGMISFPLTLTTLMFLRPKFLAALDAVTVPLIVGTYLVVLPRYGVMGAAWASSAASVCRAAIAQVAALRLVRHAHRVHRQTATRLPLPSGAIT